MVFVSPNNIHFFQANVVSEIINGTRYLTKNTFSQITIEFCVIISHLQLLHSIWAYPHIYIATFLFRSHSMNM